MLTIRDLTVHYGRVLAVQGISLEVARGEVVGLIGPNGAGKSTMLSALTGLVRPTAGLITFEQQRLVGLAPEQIVRLGISLVPEGRRIFQTLTVAENLLLGTSARSKADPDALESMLTRFPVLRMYYRASAGRLSGGEQQQLAIARALLARPRLLLLDEPSIGLAPKAIDIVFETLTALREEGTTILLVEQNARRTVAFADRTYVLRAGTVVFSGGREEFVGSDAVADLYLGVGS
jgi:branched-chain amino acid transport system ATP-binding protein